MIALSFYSFVFGTILRSRKQVYLFLIILLSIALISGVNSGIPVLFAAGIDALGNPVMASTGTVFLVAFSVGMLITSLISQFEWLSFGPFNLRLQRHLTLLVFDHVLSLPYSIIRQHSSHEIGRVVEKGLDAIRDITSNIAFFIVPTIIELAIAGFVIAYMVDPWIAAILSLALLIYGYLANISAERIRNATEGAMESGISAWTYGLDAVVNSDQVQQANLRLIIIERLNAMLKSNDRDWLVTFRQRAFFGVLQAMVFGTVVIWVLWHSTNQVVAGELTIGELVLINTYIIRLLQPVETLARVYREVHSSMGQATMLMRLLAENPVKPVGEAQAPCRTEPWAIQLQNLDILIDHRSIIIGLSLVIPAGQRLFIVGASGSGKSSLLRVLSALEPSAAGRYLVNNIEITPRNSEKTRDGIAVAHQDCLLFDLSIRDNVVIGSSASQSVIDDVLLELGLDELSLRHQLANEPTVGERGNRLSGGERQRVSLARAFVRNPNLLLLDEPTAALDEINRARVTMALNRRKNVQTQIIVTHDFGIISDEEMILFLVKDQKYILGTHGQLMVKFAYYADFVNGMLP